MTSDATDLQQPAEVLTVGWGVGAAGGKQLRAGLDSPGGTALHQAERLPNEMAPKSPLDQVALLRLNILPLM